MERLHARPRAAQAPNTFATGFRLAKGLEAARYAFCFWDLDDGEALVVDSDVPDARYWSLRLYTMAWFELVEPTGRVASLNHRQLAISADGRLRVVVSARDPGVPNWLDTGGRPVGLLTLRWFWPRGDPTPLAGGTRGRGPLHAARRHPADQRGCPS